MAHAEPAPITARPLYFFEVGSEQSHFGKLRFVGGLELTSSNDFLGAWSSIRFRPDGEHFIGILDTAHWIEGRVERNAHGRLAQLADITIVPMRDSAGNTDTSKWMMDAEGMALRDNEVLVSFEREHRIDAYPLGDLPAALPQRSIPMLVPRRQLRGNGGVEAIAVAQNGPLAGSTVIVAEKSFDEAGNLFAAIVEGPVTGRFSVKPYDGFEITDSAFLPNGDLLLLERRFTWASGVAMRLRRIRGGDIRPGAVVDGEELLRADNRFQIDNMEGMDVVRAADGSTRIILVSDDNHSILQRTLMLEFELSPE